MGSLTNPLYSLLAWDSLPSSPKKPPGRLSEIPWHSGGPEGPKPWWMSGIWSAPKIWDHRMGVFHIGWEDFTHDFGIVCPMGELRNRGSTCQIPIFMINMLPFPGYNRCGSTFFRPLPDIFWLCFVLCFVPSYKTSDDPCGSADRSWIGLRDPGIGVGKEITCCYIIYII